MKKPNIFKPNVNVNNNRKIYYSYLDNRFNIEKEEINPRDFINNLAKSNNYMFSKKVIIKTKDKTYDTKIAGVIKDKIITLDNDAIFIDEIINIYEKY